MESYFSLLVVFCMFKGKLPTIVLNWKKLMLKDENLHQIFTLTKGSAVIKLKFSFLISGG